MFSIGEISKIVNISVEALRYYDEIGLLKPCHINETNRYRYYSEDQIRDLMFILEMKEYGFSLDAIRELLFNNNPSRIEAALMNRSHELKLEHDKIIKTIGHLERRLGTQHMKETTVLIVDDVPFMRNVLRDILNNHGYTVIGEACTGEEGILKFDQLKPDIVIMDIHMPPGLDGIQATRKITEINNKAKVLICSARGQFDNILSSIRSGAQAFVVKPFQTEYLLDAMSGVLQERYNHNLELVSKWISDADIATKHSDEPLSQEDINRLLMRMNS